MANTEGTNARSQLVAAAQSLYHERGVAATSPAMVLERSGVGHGSLYYHFPTKRSLAHAAIEATCHESLGRAEADLVGVARGVDRVIAYLERDRDGVRGCRVGSLTADPTVMSDDDLREQVSAYFDGLIGLVDTALRDEGLPVGDASDLAHATVAALQGGYVLARATGDQERMRSAMRGMCRLLEGAVADHGVAG